jgi:hypothetical protein
MTHDPANKQANQMKRKNDTATPLVEVNANKRARIAVFNEVNSEHPVYNEGDLVEASYKGSRKKFPQAFVTKVYTNKKFYDLLFKDGDRSVNVSYQVISKVVNEGM